MFKNADIPYWRLSSFYFFYFCFLGAWVPFWPLFLDVSMGFNPHEIGIILSVVMITKVFGPYMWGWLADHYGHRIEIIRFGALLSFVSFLAIFFLDSFIAVLAIMAFYSFFWNAILSQFEVVTIDQLKAYPERYTQIRVWGSIGFIIAVYGLGYLFELVDISNLVIILALLLLGIFLASMIVPVNTSKPLDHQESKFRLFLSEVSSKHMVLFFIICFLLQFSHGPYYTFFTIYMEKLGYGRGQIGLLWSLGVLAEVVLFMFMHRIFARYSLGFLISITCLLTTIRWALIAYFGEHLLVLLFAQILHAASFGSFHACAIETIRRSFSKQTSGQAQAFYSATSFGLGGATGAIVSGYLYDYGFNILFLSAGIVAFLAYLLSLKTNINKT